MASCAVLVGLLPSDVEAATTMSDIKIRAPLVTGAVEVSAAPYSKKSCGSTTKVFALGIASSVAASVIMWVISTCWGELLRNWMFEGLRWLRSCLSVNSLFVWRTNVRNWLRRISYNELTIVVDQDDTKDNQDCESVLQLAPLMREATITSLS